MITISKACIEDAPVLTSIKNCALDQELRKYFGRGGRPADYDSVDVELELMQEYDVYKILLNGNIIGEFLMQWVSDEVVELEDFAIAPEFQGNGYGYRVLQMIEEMYPSVREWRFSTLAISVGSQHLYEKAGFYVLWKNDEEVRYIKRKPTIQCLAEKPPIQRLASSK